MPSIRFYAPTGVDSVTLTEGPVLPVKDGYITADSKFALELLKAGFTPATEDAVSTQRDAYGAIVLMVGGVTHQITPRVVRVGMDAGETIAAAGGVGGKAWDRLDFDTIGGNVWTPDAADRFVVPAGFSWARVAVQYNLYDPQVDRGYTAHIQKNAAQSALGMGLGSIGIVNASGQNNVPANNEWQPVVAGDYFSSYLINSHATLTLSINPTGRTWFFMELK